MGPKRQRGESSSSTRHYDRHRFVSAEAAERFDTYLAGKALTPERGLRPHAITNGEMSEQIMERGWYHFTEQPDAAVISVVKEFYANASNTPPFETMVREKKVSFSSESINAYYAIPPPRNCEYSRYIRCGPNYDRIVQELCKPGTTWSSKGPRGGTYFLSKDLSKYGKIWYAFLCAKLMPAQHVSDVPREKAPLLYALVKDMPINVGDIIAANIRRLLDRPFQGGLPHPSMICGLCYQAGVRWGPDESVKRPMSILDSGLIARYDVWDGAPSDPRGVGFLEAQPEEQARTEDEEAEDDDDNDDDIGDAPEEASGPSSSRQPPKARFSNQFRNLQSMLNQQAQRVERQNQRLAARQDHMFAYQTSFNQSLIEMFSRMAPTVDPVQFPVPHPMPPYPPCDDDDAHAPDA